MHGVFFMYHGPVDKSSETYTILLLVTAILSLNQLDHRTGTRLSATLTLVL